MWPVRWIKFTRFHLKIIGTIRVSSFRYLGEIVRGRAAGRARTGIHFAVAGEAPAHAAGDADRLPVPIRIRSARII